MRPYFAELLSKAMRHAALILADERRRGSGEPAFLHPMRVMLSIPADRGAERVTAILHDIQEDFPTWWTRIADDYPEPIREAVDLLTHPHGCRDECYRQYILRLRSNAIARRVKVADLQDNLNDHPGEKRELYLWALEHLGERGQEDAD